GDPRSCYPLVPPPVNTTVKPNTLSCLPLGWEEGITAARLGWKLAREGRRVPTIDLLIAATALSHHCEVWHFGDHHFKAIAQIGGPPERDLTA
ncbi:MAG: PIN domain-containing protein, partial [Thermoleophilia bacterium]|nr:PIN domain-containing protein [Thermoleophilia bacterium]